MKLLSCHIENFGTLSDYSYEFSDGVNRILAENGWGKTTFADFIKAMFFGFPSGNKRSVSENPRKHYTPWNNGKFGGSIDFATADGEWRIERFFGSKESADSFRLYNLRTGRESDRFDESIGQELFGIDAQAYQRSAFISGEDLIPSNKDGITGICSRLSGLLDDVDDLGSFDSALEALDDKRRYYEKNGGKGRIADIEHQLAVTEREMEEARAAENSAKIGEKRIAELMSDISSADAMREKLNQLIRREKSRETVKKDRENLDAIKENLQKAQEDAERLSEFFKGSLPDENKLAECGQLIREYAELTNREKTERMPETDLKWLDQLSSAYLPDDDELAECNRLDRERISLCAQLSGYIVTDDESDKYASFREKFGKGAPSGKEREELFALEKSLTESRARLCDAEEKCARLRTDDFEVSTPIGRFSPEKYKKIAKFSAIGAGVGAIFACVGGIFSLLPMLIAGIFLALCGLALCFSAYVKCKLAEKQVSDNSEAAERKKAYLEAERKCSELTSECGTLRDKLDVRLAGFGVVCPDEKYREYINRLISDAEEYERICNIINQKEKNYSETSAKISETDRKLGELLKTAPVETAGWDAVIRRIMLEKAEYESLASRKKQCDERNAAISVQLTEKYGKISAFLSGWYSMSRNDSPEVLLDDLRKRAAELGVCLQKVAEYKAIYDNFMANKPELANCANQPETENELPESIPELEEKLKNLEKLREDNLNLLTLTQKKVDESYEQGAKLPELEATYDALLEEKTLCEKRLRAIRCADKYLREARDNLSTRYLKSMKESFGRYFAVITGGQERIFDMNTDFDVSFRMAGEQRGIDWFSAGWRDLIGICTRLALIEALYENEKPFLIFDDPFINLDDQKTDQAKKLLENIASDYQIVYFTCNRSRT